MKKSIKAALYSGLVFPGVGHFSLKHYLRGLAFFVPAMSSLIFQVDYALNKATDILSQVDAGTIPLDATAISDMLTASPNHSVMFLLNLSSWIIVACWLLGIIDSYRLGNIEDQSKS